LNTGKIYLDYYRWWSKWLSFENRTGIQMVKARWQPKMLQPFESRSHIQMIDSLEPGIQIPHHLNTGFQFVWYSNDSGIQMFGIQIPIVKNGF
jgi:hypothetical protein